MIKQIILKTVKIAATSLLSFSLMSANSQKSYRVTLYPMSQASYALTPVEKIIYAKNTEELSKRILDELFILQEKEEYVKLLSPKTKTSLHDDKVWIDIYKDIPKEIKDTTDYELFTIYSLVNSITSSGDISTVNFTIEGLSQRDFCGYVDMRETFIPDYDICT